MLWQTTQHLLQVAKTGQTGFLLQLQASAAFHAFTFEAYLNHVGSEEIDFWEEIERSSHSHKLSVLAKHLKFPCDLGQRPFQTLRNLVELRNALAHGKTTAIDLEVETSKTPSEDAAWCLLPREKLTCEDLERYSEDLREAVKKINQARRQPDPYLWNEGARSTQISPA
jgi:hypothetical protein